MDLCRTTPPAQSPVQNEVDALFLSVLFQVPTKGLRHDSLHVLLGHVHVLFRRRCKARSPSSNSMTRRCAMVQFVVRCLTAVGVCEQFLRFLLQGQCVLLQLLLAGFHLHLQVGLHGFDKRHALLQTVSMDKRHHGPSSRRRTFNRWWGTAKKQTRSRWPSTHRGRPPRAKTIQESRVSCRRKMFKVLVRISTNRNNTPPP